MSPHTDWWRACEGRTPRNRAAFPAHAGPGGYPPDPFAFARARYGVEALPASGSFRAGARRLPVIRSSIPGQDGTQPGGWFRGDPDGWPGDWLGDAVAHLPKLAPDAVILGIVDMGIPLGHHRFRLKGGRKTRILASWQQASAAKGQAYLPFGQELCAGEIDALIDRHTHGSHLDEDAFNRDAALVEPHLPWGGRDLDFRTSHGAHVLDLAGGLDAADEPDLARRLRIISVNLPPQLLHGPAGDYLQYFAAWGILRIVGLADALWDRDHAKRKEGGFPIALNLSYGMQAGPKDGTEPLETLIAGLIAARDRARARTKPGRKTRLEKPPLRVQMPAGNANQLQCAARLDPEEGVPLELPWRLQPEDQTSNHAEIWSPPRSGDAPPGFPGITVTLTPPGGPSTSLAAHPGRHVDVKRRGGARVGRIYCLEQACARGRKRLSFLFAVGPTADLGLGPRPGRPPGGVDLAAFLPEALRIPELFEPPEVTEFPAPAPAGLWTIGLEISEGCGWEAWQDGGGGGGGAWHAYVQSDQSFVQYSPMGRHSYFDTPGYEKYLENGRLADSVGYRGGGAAAGQGPVTRFGTHNAIAQAGVVATIGGFRRSDGCPAFYSSTGRGAGDVNGLYPSEDGYAHPGILASGARSGASAWYSGTSMAAALATRWVAMKMLDHASRWDTPGDLGPAALETEIGGGEDGTFTKADSPKVGAGRYRAPLPGRTRRAPRM